MKGRATKGRVPLVTAAVALVLSTLFATAMASTTLPGSSLGVALSDCSEITLPANEEINTVLDLEDHVLGLSYFDEGVGEDREVFVDYRDERCLANPRTNERIQHALQAAKEDLITICESFREAVRNDKQVDRGRRVNLDAANRFIEEWCN